MTRKRTDRERYLIGQQINEHRAQNIPIAQTQAVLGLDHNDYYRCLRLYQAREFDDEIKNNAKVILVEWWAAQRKSLNLLLAPVSEELRKREKDPNAQLNWEFVTRCIVKYMDAYNSAIARMETLGYLPKGENAKDFIKVESRKSVDSTDDQVFEEAIRLLNEHQKRVIPNPDSAKLV
jgi:hypothetical protein